MTADELQIGVGRWSLNARGSLIVYVLLLALLGAGLEWNDMTRSARSEQQHGSIVQALEIQTCIQSVPFEERKRLREELARSANPIQTLRLGWCPWMQKLGGNNK